MTLTIDTNALYMRLQNGEIDQADYDALTALNGTEPTRRQRFLAGPDFGDTFEVDADGWAYAQSDYRDETVAVAWIDA